MAAEWIGERVSELEEQTGMPVRVEQRRLGETGAWPDADAAVIAPATLNTVNTLALGLTPHFVGAFVAEGIGKGWPMTLMPCVNSAYATHPAFKRSIGELRGAGVNVLFGEGGFQPNPPGSGKPADYPWQLALDAAAEDAHSTW